ncbi:hypothetical protein [Methanobrevibacter sp.]|uniref:hypothetical protein n=1 Tax=Methanobrevibacter sp. TaxID=66852 RepID=UPI00388D5544
MNLKNLINTGLNSMQNSNEGIKKQKIFNDQYCEKKSFDVKIQEVKHGINWKNDFFKFKTQIF